MNFKNLSVFIVILIFVLAIAIPLSQVNFSAGKVSSAENRILVSFPQAFNADGIL